MIRRKSMLMVLGLVAALSFSAFASDWAIPAGASGVWSFHNLNGASVTGLHIEFEQEVTIVSKVDVGGYLAPVGEMTGMVFDFIGELVDYGTVVFEFQPVEAVPSLVMWMSGERPVGTPFFTSVAVLGRLFGQGIVAVREANPAALGAAFEQFFLDNAEYLSGLSESLGMDLQTSLMPIIMSSPAEGIENFFATIVGMLGATSLEDVLEGGINFGALFALLGL